MPPTETELRSVICEVARRLDARNLVAATDGNVSYKLNEGRYLGTPSGCRMANVRPDELVIADAAGNLIAGEGRVSSEFFTHLAAYEERPDIRAVVHAHPPVAVAFTLAGRSLEEPVLPEVVFALGGIPTAPYAPPGTREGGEAIRGLIRDCDAVMLDRHGAIAVGRTVMDAYLRMEKLEHAAQTLWHAATLGEARPLNHDEIARIVAAREAYGASGKVYLP